MRTKKTGRTMVMKASKTPEEAINRGPEGAGAEASLVAEGEAMPNFMQITLRIMVNITHPEVKVDPLGVAMGLRDAEVVVVAAAVPEPLLRAVVNLRVAKAGLRVKIHPPMLEASKAVLTHGPTPMRTTKTLVTATNRKTSNKWSVIKDKEADVVEAVAVAAVAVNLVKTLLIMLVTGAMISPTPMNGTMKSTPAHWQIPRYLRPPEASLNLVRNSERRSLRASNSNSLKGKVANEVST